MQERHRREEQCGEQEHDLVFEAANVAAGRAEVASVDLIDFVIAPYQHGAPSAADEPGEPASDGFPVAADGDANDHQADHDAAEDCHCFGDLTDRSCP